ncbi:MAG: 2,3-bisphosphoglycerate-independent phosphoglycerate mutase [Hyphomicrobiaceae bacterium]|jgi:2,3-bisphosphoglycerate-independent phosphoglycerate mutase
MSDTHNSDNIGNSDTIGGPTVLCILDGWAQRESRDNNAIALADTPNWDRLIKTWPHDLLDCSGPDVGLPDGQMGNSEVGHMNLGAGRVVWQDLPRINNAIADGSLAGSSILSGFVETLKQSGGACHLAGLVSSGGVHSHISHIVELARLVAKEGVPVCVHAILDGRDTPPNSAIRELADFTRSLDPIDGVQISTICGRYFAMDRDNRWDRVELAYNVMVTGEGAPFEDLQSAVQANYDAGYSDEFIRPGRSKNYHGMADGDGILFANFRADRAREILGALIDPQFDGFQRKSTVSFATALGLVSYSATLNKLCDALFPPVYLQKTLGEVVANASRRQLRMAETEKYAHVTFFFNGRSEVPFAGEERQLVPSPKVATYDLQPEMSAPELTDKLVTAIGSGAFDLIVVNYANGDMVGHTGDLDAAMAAVRCVDDCIGRVEEAVLAANGVMLLTADHGNCELMVDPDTGEPHTAHTLNPVPIVLINHTDPKASLARGRLADVAPTLLDLLHVPQPEEMTGQTLIRPA